MVRDEQQAIGIAALPNERGAEYRTALDVRAYWTREEFTALAGVYGVLPDGALDLVNEVAIDAVGAPVI